MANLIDVYNLKSNASLKARVAAAIAKASYDIQNESASTTNHAKRLIWSNYSLINAEESAEKILWALVQNPTIQSSGLSSTDNDIQFVVNSLIDIFAVNM
jgi:hypothetical protein